jgi:cell division protein FtsZ
MTINFSTPHDNIEMRPRISVVGVGGAGGNAVNNMIRSNLEGVDFIVTNTDNQALSNSLADRRLQLGMTVTQGLGAGSRPDVGKAAAEEAMDQLLAELGDSNMVFITAGMGGGTGTGAGPVIAQAARERGILTVGVVTKPFHFEGAHRMRLAEQGIEELTKYVDTLIIIPNQNLFRIANEKTTFADAFNMADNVLHQGVRGVTDLMVMPGLINLDFADIRTVMGEMGKAMMGTGEASGEKRAVDAAESAIKNPLLDDMSMKGARGVLINITGGMDMTLFEVDEAANRIREEVDADANIIFGSTFDEKLDGLMRVSVVATGISAEGIAAKPRPQMTLVSSQVAPIQEGLSKEEGVITSPEKSMVSKQLKEEFTSEQFKKTGTDDEVIDGDNEAIDNFIKTSESSVNLSDPNQIDVSVPNTADDNLVAPEGLAMNLAIDTEPPTNKDHNNFIPSAPILTAKSIDVAETKDPDPFNAAALVNTGLSGTAKKGRNLFQRVTGMGKKGNDNDGVEENIQKDFLKASLPIAPKVDLDAGSPPMDIRIGEIENKSIQKTDIDESLLDIPAFLRRPNS